MGAAAVTDLPVGDGEDIGEGEGEGGIEGGVEGEDDGDEEEEENDEDEDGDDSEDDGDTEDEKGGLPLSLAADTPQPAERLPILEDSPSHLLIKRLLMREARQDAARLEGAQRTLRETAGKDSEVPAPPVFAKLFLERAAGRLAGLATSSRACFILLELANCADASVSTVVLNELRASSMRTLLQEQVPSPGRDALLHVILGSAKAPANSTSAVAESSEGPASSGAIKSTKKGPITAHPSGVLAGGQGQGQKSQGTKRKKGSD